MNWTTEGSHKLVKSLVICQMDEVLSRFTKQAECESNSYDHLFMVIKHAVYDVFWGSVAFDLSSEQLNQMADYLNKEKYIPWLDSLAHQATGYYRLDNSPGAVIKRVFSREAFHNLIVGWLNVGPFDGGCGHCALAIQRVFGGETFALVCKYSNNHYSHDHYGVGVRGKIYDMSGGYEEKDWSAAFNKLTMNNRKHIVRKAKPAIDFGEGFIDELEKLFREEMDVNTSSHKLGKRADAEAYSA